MRCDDVSSADVKKKKAARLVHSARRGVLCECRWSSPIKQHHPFAWYNRVLPAASH